MSDIEESIYDERKRSHDDEELNFSREYPVNDANRYSKRPALISGEQEDSRHTSRALAFRCLVTTREAGIIIGKQGRNISSLRERSGARITISEMIPGAHERVLSVVGTAETTSMAFGLLAEHIPKETDSSDASSQTERLVNFRLLIPHGRMGSIIGKGGLKIKEIQDRSNAKLHASEDVLPQSTERTLTITGFPNQIQSAVREVGYALKELSERSSNVILFKPSASRSGSHGSSNPMFNNPGYNGHSNSHSNEYNSGLSSSGYLYPYQSRGEIPMGGNSGYPMGAHQNSAAMPPLSGGPSSAPTQAQQIYIPNEMVGCIIGKGGAKINEMRMLSGASIKVAEAVNGSTERLVTITGTPESNRVALHLLYTRLEAEKSKILAAASAHR